MAENGRPVPVPLKSILDVARHADVVLGGVTQAAEDVDDALADAEHAEARSTARAIARIWAFSRAFLERRRAGTVDLRRVSGLMLAKLEQGPPLLASRASARQTSRVGEPTSVSRRAERADLDEARRRRAKSGWEAGIRTPISRVRVCCPTVERPPSIGRT